MQPFMMSPRAQIPLPGQVLALPSEAHVELFLNAARGDRRGKGRLKGEAASALVCRRILC